MKLIVYTCVTDAYDSIQVQPKVPDVRYLLYTNGSPIEGWEYHPIPGHGVRAARYVKIMSHEVLPKHDVSIYIDGCLQFLKDPKELVKIAEGDVSICKHPSDKDCFEHGQRLFKAQRLEKYHNDIRHHIKAYESMDLPRRVKFYETSLIVRRNTEQTARLNEAWWRHFSKHSTRDQLSLYGACCETGIWPSYLPFQSRKNVWTRGWGQHRLNAITGKPTKYLSVRPTPTRVPQLNTLRKVSKPRRTVVATVAIGQSMLYKKTLPLMHAFAKRNKYEFVVIDRQGSHIHPAWAKLECGRVMRETGCETLLFVDADVIIPVRAVSPIEYYPAEGVAALNTPQWLPYAQHWPFERAVLYPQRWEGAASLIYPLDHYINSGVIIVNKDSIGFFDPPSEEVSDGRAWEQTWLSCQTARFPYHSLSRIWNWGHLDSLDYLQLAIRDKNIQFIHLSGCANKLTSILKLFGSGGV